MNKESLINLIREQCSIVVECLPEHTPVRGNAIASGDDALDREVEDKILADLEWNQWAWCVARVSATWEGIEEDEYLGVCSYGSEEEFRSDYYEDMVHEAVSRIAERVINIRHKTQELSQ